VGDRRLIRLIQKWLKAGVLEDGQLIETTEGTPQGSVISPLLANATLAATAATKAIPIVFAVSTDPVQLGLVPSLNRPGGNLTGISAFGREVAAKGLEGLHELLPATASVGFLENPSNPIGELQKNGTVCGSHHLLDTRVRCVGWPDQLRNQQC